MSDPDQSNFPRFLRFFISASADELGQFWSNEADLGTRSSPLAFIHPSPDTFSFPNLTLNT
jgi:hypothetical protein